jgi:hypothetical protein
MSLKIGIDFDHTYAADPETWHDVVETLLDAGHHVYLVTKRHDDGPHVAGEVYEVVTNEIPIVFCGRTGIVYKHDLMVEYHDVEVDVWIDDKPEFIKGPDKIKEDLDQMVYRNFALKEEMALFREYVDHLEDVIQEEASHLWDDLKNKFKHLMD